MWLINESSRKREERERKLIDNSIELFGVFLNGVESSIYIKSSELIFAKIG